MATLNSLPLWTGKLYFRPAVSFISSAASDPGVPLVAYLRPDVSDHAAVKPEKAPLPDGKGWPRDIVCTSSMGLKMEEVAPLLDGEDTLWSVDMKRASEDVRIGEQAAGMLNQRVAFEVDCGDATLYLWGDIGCRGPFLRGALRPSLPGKTPFTRTYAVIRAAQQLFLDVERQSSLGGPWPWPAADASRPQIGNDSTNVELTVPSTPWRGLLRMPDDGGLLVDVLCEASCIHAPKHSNFLVTWPKVICCDHRSFVWDDDEERDVYAEGDVVVLFTPKGHGKLKLKYLAAYLIAAEGTFRILCPGGTLSLWSMPSTKHCFSLFGTWRKSREL